MDFFNARITPLVHRRKCPRTRCRRLDGLPPYDTTSGNSGFFADLNAATPDFPNPAKEPDPSQGLLGHSRYARHTGFGSMHSNGVNFAFADGSVRTVGRTDDWLSLYAIFGAFDGDVNFDLAKPSSR